MRSGRVEISGIHNKMNIRCSISGMGAIKAKLSKLQGDLRNPQIPMMEAAIQITAETQRNFEDGGRPEAWAPLGLMTLFIRAHRADGPKRTGENIPLSDTGRLKGSMVPFTSQEENAFGVATNVEYAGLMQNGGVSEAQDIPIAGYTRRMPVKGGAIARSMGENRLTKSGKDKRTGKIKDYILHLAGGKPIEPRPFFPRTLEELSDWGYQAKIKSIFWNFFQPDL